MITKKKNSAFLLIEVMVTVVIVLVSVIFISHAFTHSFRAAALSSDYLSGVFLLEDKAFDLELYPEVEEGEFSGEESFMDKSFRWDETVSSLESDDLRGEYAEDPQLKRLKLTIYWQRRNVERSIDIITYAPSKEYQE